MRTRFSSLRSLIGAVLVAGGFIAACSSQARHSNTTVAQAGPPLGQSHVSRLPSNNSAAPPDAAEAPERPVDHALPLSRGAQGRAPVQPPQPSAPTGTPTDPSTPPPTPASPNAPVSAPAPNPIPPSGGGPTTDNGSTGSPAGDTPTSTQGPTTDTGARNGETGQAMNAFGYIPYQGGVDGGVGPAPIQRADGGVAPLPRGDGGVAPLPRVDGGSAPIGGGADGGLR